MEKKIQLCDYGCGQEATYFFPKTKKWCCSHIVFRCPSVKERIYVPRFVDSFKSRAKRLLESGEAKCFYCGEKAIKWVGGTKFICKDKAFDCKVFKYENTKAKKDRYNKPEMVQKFTTLGLELQNRKDIKEKKKESMLKLHNGTDSKAIEFQNHYRKGREEFNKRFVDRYKKFLRSKNFTESELDLSQQELKKIVIKLRGGKKDGKDIKQNYKG